MELTRRDDWPERLADTIAATLLRPFCWGESDCVQFAAACIRAMTDADVIPRVADYASEAGALRQIRRFAPTLAECVDAKLGLRIAPVCARRGDLVLHEANLGVVVDHEAMFCTPAGLTRLPLAWCTCGWRVG